MFDGDGNKTRIAGRGSRDGKEAASPHILRGIHSASSCRGAADNLPHAAARGALAASTSSSSPSLALFEENASEEREEGACRAAIPLPWKSRTPNNASSHTATHALASAASFTLLVFLSRYYMSTSTEWRAVIHRELSFHHERRRQPDEDHCKQSGRTHTHGGGGGVREEVGRNRGKTTRASMNVQRHCSPAESASRTR